MRLLGDLLWYILLALGTWRALTLARDARGFSNPVHAARGAASAFGVAGLVLWYFYVRDEVRSGFVLTHPSLMGLLGVIGTAVIFGAIILIPMWSPRLLLRRERPSTLRRILIVLIARFVMAFAAACILIAPLMSSFASSLGEFAGMVFGIAAPLVVLILVSDTLVKAVRRLPEGL